MDTTKYRANPSSNWLACLLASLAGLSNSLAVILAEEGGGQRTEEDNWFSKGLINLPFF